MINTTQYFAKPHTSQHEELAEDLLLRVNSLRDEFFEETKAQRLIDPDTGTEISGSKGGAGDGGFRTPTEGDSAHEHAMAVDAYDPGDLLDNWITKFDGKDGVTNWKLESYDLYREHPSKTPGWCHLTTRRPGTGNRTFYP